MPWPFLPTVRSGRRSLALPKHRRSPTTTVCLLIFSSLCALLVAGVYPVKPSAYDSTGKADYAFSPSTRHACPAGVQPSHLLGSALAASSFRRRRALAGCQRPSTLKVVQHTTGGGRDDLSDSVMRQGQDSASALEAALRSVQLAGLRGQRVHYPHRQRAGRLCRWLTTMQIAKIVCKAPVASPLPSKQSFSGLIDSLNNGQIDLIIAGMSATPEREESVGFSDPYFIGYFGLFVKEGSPYQNATKLSDFSGATVLGQRTPCSILSSTRFRALSTRTRSIRSPRCSRTC